MAQIQSESESESCSVSHVDSEQDPIVVAHIHSNLKEWCASSVEDFNKAEITREYKFAAPPNWTCIICKEAIRDGSIFQCMQGHLACSDCSTRGTSCRACSNAVSRIRNLEIQKVMAATLATCKYVTLGCTEFIKFNDLDNSEHEKTCSFGPIACPMPECHQVGVKNLFSQHLLTKHDIDLLVDLTKTCRWQGCWRSKDFELGSSTKVVLLREIIDLEWGNCGADEPQTEVHLLHQEVTEFYDKLHITPLTESSERWFELEVITDCDDVTYSLKGKFDRQLEHVLLLPKKLGGQSLKKDCHVRTH